jgi:hypothetical protein
MMEDMGQQHLTAHPTDNSDDNAIDVTTHLSAPGDNGWQQAQLPIGPERPRLQQPRQTAPRAYAGKPTERLRQVGLVGIARARAALADAARRADQAREAQQATKAA